ncbi:hypothetical protein CXF80_00390 [Shewanella sp. Actino-trap-3]|nr:hypothetical protein CXF80_00390 [Shewanella sp. Actino-trap-3]|tara:strand:+ start:28205 stop:28429 length:225 start_codon:yes stop_codon:yes gene_type:complete
MTKVTISRLDTDVGTFRTTVKLTPSGLLFSTVDILGCDGWEALIIDPHTLWYKTLVAACEVHLSQQRNNLVIKK